MFGSLNLFSLLLTSATFLQLCKAFPQVLPADTVAYLTNCQRSDTGVLYSEVSMYLDGKESFAGQVPDQTEDTILGQVTTWEGAEVTWFYAGGDPNIADKLTEFINPNAQDASVPVDSQVGCARYVDGFEDMAEFYRFKCFKDTPRVLYTTGDHECSTIYYCKRTEQACDLPSEG
jgi:hypothetical protein